MKQLSKMQYKPDPTAKPYHDLVITDQAKQAVDKLFTVLEAMFPAWRVTMKTLEEVKNTKLVWTKALVRNKRETGTNLNIELGLINAEKSTSDFFPSVGKFIDWCADKSYENDAKQALASFNANIGVINAVEKETRARCGYDAKRLSREKSDKLFLDTYYDVVQNRPDLINAVLLEEPSDQKRHLSIFIKRENQAEINEAGIDNLKSLFKQKENNNEN